LKSFQKKVFHLSGLHTRTRASSMKKNAKRKQRSENQSSSSVRNILTKLLDRKKRFELKRDTLIEIDQIDQSLAKCFRCNSSHLTFNFANSF